MVVEAGPGRTVCGMVLADMAERSDVRMVPLLAQTGEQEVNGSQALGQLWQYHLPVQWPDLPITPARFSRLPPYPLPCGGMKSSLSPKRWRTPAY